MASDTSTVCADQLVEELRRELAEAREQQAATAGILAAMSSSPTDPYRVFADIAASAARLCDAQDSAILQLADGTLRLLARYGTLPTVRSVGESGFPFNRGVVVARAIIDKMTIHVADVLVETEEFPESSKLAQRVGHRSVLAVPLMRAGEAIGAIAIRRAQVRPFTERQIELLKTFADQAVIAIENTRLFEAEQASKRELQESLEYQTATSEVLNVISRSPNELQPVFDVIAQSASRLCGDEYAIVARYDGELLHLVAQHNPRPGSADETARWFPHPPVAPSVLAPAVADNAVVHISDIEDEELPQSALEAFRRISLRAVVAVPMIHKSRTIGTIAVSRAMPGAFPQRQIDVLRTFADQAVIAIENARLFEEVKAQTHNLSIALQRQTATSEILEIISASPGQLQPVFNAILERARELCAAKFGHLLLLDGQTWRAAALHNLPIAYADFWRSAPRVAFSGTLLSRLRETKQPYQLEDLRLSEPYRMRIPLTVATVELAGARTLLGVPLLKDGRVIGAIVLHRTDVCPFDERQIALLSSFADQAVIAIENTRLFEEVQARTRELTNALEQQTATSEVLSVISSSPTDTQPVFSAIAKNAVQLCNAMFGAVFSYDGTLVQFVAGHQVTEDALRLWRDEYPIPPRGLIRRAITDRAVVNVADMFEDPRVANVEVARTLGNRSQLVVPMLQGHQVIGTINVYGAEPVPFTDAQIALLETFADQAVIAIENTRLFEAEQSRTRELQESLKYQTAISEVLSVISRSQTEIRPVFDAILESAVRLCGADQGGTGKVENGMLVAVNWFPDTPEVAEVFRNNFPRPIDTSSIVGQAVLEGKVLHVSDVDAPDAPKVSTTVSKELGYRAQLSVPLLRDGQPIGVIALVRKAPEPFTPPQIGLATTFADQAVIAIENTRLFEEVQARTRELARTVEDLEIASQHKSQFVANMSHELRTPLAAILGFAELMQEGFYEPQGPKSLAALTRIRSNGKHLLGLINTVLDIAKVESGQFKLNLGEYALENVVETVRSATESLAENKKLAFHTEVATRLPVGLGDEQRLTQVLLNLVGNAIKFTDAGEVRIAAKAINGHFAITVADTGPGIPEQHQARIFEQFHQVDSSNTKAKGGTGLGLAIAKQIVEMHGGRIWVESTLGQGATFQLELPIRAAALGVGQ